MRRIVRWMIVPALALVVGCGQESATLSSGPHASLACAACHGTGPATAGFAADATCVECHARISPEAELAAVRFRHEKHGTFAGADVACAACHTHTGGGEDLHVESTQCALCHAQLPGPDSQQAASLPESECVVCHAQPSHVAFANTGAPIDHATVLQRGISCVQCHFDLVSGTGSVDRTACRTCHASAGLSTRGLDEPRADDVHAAHSAAACDRCHTPVEHRVGSLAAALVLECETCHAPGDPNLVGPRDPGVHRAQQLLYTGLVEEEGVEPAKKFVARVACDACHSPDTTTLPAGYDRAHAIEAQCLSCHGDSFAGLVDVWARGMQDRTETVGRWVGRAASDPAIRGNAEADSLAKAAVATWETVRSANGIHNLPAADALLRRSVERAENAYLAARRDVPARPALGPDPAVVTCVRCHYGIEETLTSVASEVFDHRVHVFDAKIACERCHSSADLFQADGRTRRADHGQTNVTPSDCRSCHHSSATISTCSECHAPAELVRKHVADVTVAVEARTPRRRQVAWSHATHASVSCASCHDGAHAWRATADAQSCRACHESHHEEGRSCATCHDVLGNAHATVADPHVACDRCHDRGTVLRLEPDGGFCRTCHTVEASHQVDSGKSCTVCHFLETSHDFRRILVSGG